MSTMALRSSRIRGRFSERYGPWAIVTGASSGLGRAIGEQLAAEGLNLILVARGRDALVTLADELTARHSIAVRVLAADLSDATAVEAVSAACADLDVGLLVAAAGFGTSGAFLRADPVEECAMLDVNCRALMLQALHFGRRFTARGRGGVVLVASLVGFQGTPFAAHYAATKAYVQALAEGLSVEFAASGVDVLASAPGPVRTGFAGRADLRMGAALSPETVARATLSALGRRTTVLPGALTKVLAYSLAPLPRPLRARIMGRVMAGMTKHQHEHSTSEARTETKLA